MLWLWRTLPCLVLVGCLSAGVQAGESELSPDQFFDQQVQPILAANCFKCHGGEAKIKGGFRLTDRDSFLAGGDSGGALEDNVFLEAINYESYEMPPQGKLPTAQIAILTKWAKLGAPWSNVTKDFGHRGESERNGVPEVNEETMSFWSYQPVERPTVPSVASEGWVKNPIDAFIYARLMEHGLQPNPKATRSQLIRRAYYDLTGIPPTPAEVAAFAENDAPDAYEKLLDHLLDSPHYGERWGRHWLDLVRYAETNSFERDGAKPHIWRYRDYVIDSFNSDKPYDEFVREQLAGDELDNVTSSSFIATGYFRLGQWDDEPTDQLQADFDGLDDIIATTGQVMLGMTVNCARCHDHKIDPIPQQDYYRLLAFFRGLRPYGHRGLDDANLRMFDTRTGQAVPRAEANELRQKGQRLEKAKQRIEGQFRRRLSPPEQEDFAFEPNRAAMIRSRPGILSAEKLEEYEALLGELQEVNMRTLTAFGVSEVGSEPPTTHVMIRGNAHAEGDEVRPGFPSVLGFAGPEDVRPRDTGSSGRRLALADWIASEANPLTARVLVNRLWQHHFGRGIVRTPNDFGFQGAPPTHPRLLDWLAADFVSGGWTLKRMHKLIMMSNTYQMSSAPNPECAEQDVDNDLFWRMDMRRLSAEEIRDSILATNGTLNLAVGGPSIYPTIPADVLAGQSRPGNGWGTSSPHDAARRSIYIHVKRSLITPILASFDFADTDFSCPVRFATTQPTQALGMLNSAFLNEQAALFAERVRQDAGQGLKQRVTRALALATQRAPSADEINRGVRFIRHAQQEHGATQDVALDQFCLIVLNLNEFMYLD